MAKAEARGKGKEVSTRRVVLVERILLALRMDE